jgi:2Fe-2S ferredoxin
MSIAITFVQPDGTAETIEVEDLNQTLMEAARNRNIPGIAADCGGACACATCHVHIDPAWMKVVGPANAIEADMLDLSAEPTETSRLSCQIELRAEFDGLRVAVAE